jgi:hypothetical protein
MYQFIAIFVRHCHQPLLQFQIPIELLELRKVFGPSLVNKLRE